MIKTKENWDLDESEKDLDEYLQPGDEIDEEMYWHIGCGYMPAHWQGGGWIQGGDPDNKIQGTNIYTYATAKEINGRFYYLGILPEFKPF